MDGLRVIQNDRGGPLNGAKGYYALTTGLNREPVNWMTVRPEVRYDWSNKARAFDAGNNTDQFTFSTDLIINF